MVIVMKQLIVELTNKFYDLLVVRAAKVKVEVKKEDVHRLLQTYCCMVGTDEDETFVGNNDMSKYLVPTVFKGLIPPRRVYLNVTDFRQQIDLMNVDVKDARDSVLSLSEYKDIIYSLYHELKLAEPACNESIASLSRYENWDQVSLVKEGYLADLKVKTIPVQLKDEFMSCCFADRKFTVSMDEYVDEMVRDIRSNILK